MLLVADLGYITMVAKSVLLVADLGYITMVAKRVCCFLQTSGRSAW